MKPIFVRRLIPIVASLLVTLLSPGCHRHPHPVDTAASASSHAHDDEAASPTAQVTVWGQRHEAFVEHPLAVAGTPVRWMIHLTDLATGEPRTTGPLKLGLQRDSQPEFVQTVDTPTHPGIYEPNLTLPDAGEWNVRLILPTAEGDSIIVLPRLKVFASEKDAAQNPPPEPPDGIRFLKEQQWKLRMVTSPVTQRRLVDRLSLPAQIQAPPGGKTTVVAPIAGQLHPPPDQPLPLPGTTVFAGQLLALLEPRFPDAAAQVIEIDADLGRATAALRQAEAAHQRVQQLVAVQAKSERELEETAAALATAQSRHAAAVALHSAHRQTNTPAAVLPSGLPAIELRAPVSGRVEALGAGPYQSVPSEHPLFTVLQSDRVWIEARLPEWQIGRLPMAPAAAYEFPDQRGHYIELVPPVGRLIFLGQQIDPTTRTLSIVYEVTNPGGRLRFGQSVLLHVETARAEDALAVPESAIVDELGRPVAFVAIAGESFAKRELTLGIHDQGWVQVLAGLAEGERVVTRAAFAVRLASIAPSLPSHGHAH